MDELTFVRACRREVNWVEAAVPPPPVSMTEDEPNTPALSARAVADRTPT